jgi:endonuclease-3
MKKRASPAKKTPARKKTSHGQAETPNERKHRSRKILARLRKDFPSAKTALLHENPFQLLIATILSAQCTDARVNMVTPGLFMKYPGPIHFAAAAQAELEQDIRSTGFFRMKAKNIIACSLAITERFGGEVPPVMEELVTLPGVGRKTANVVLGQAFGISSGVVVDTHVGRVAQRLGFSAQKNPEKIEQDLMALLPQDEWTDCGTLLILHGRTTCHARSPKCEECSVERWCPKVGLRIKN